jgi:hypothetical protein
LLGFLAISTNARHLLRHVDVTLVSGSEGLGTYAQNALSELNLQTLTIRCFPIKGSEGDWTKCFKLRLLMKTRGVKKVTLAAPESIMNPQIRWLTASDPLGHKLVTQLLRPAITPRRDLSRLPIMPDYPRPGVSGCMPRPVYPMRWSITDFRGFNSLRNFRNPWYLMPDPLCDEHKDAPSCQCIGSSTLIPFSPSRLADIFHLENAQEAALNVEAQEFHWSRSTTSGTSPG